MFRSVAVEPARSALIRILARAPNSNTSKRAATAKAVSISIKVNPGMFFILSLTLSKPRALGGIRRLITLPPRGMKASRSHPVGNAAIMERGKGTGGGNPVNDRAQNIVSPLPPAISENNAIIIRIDHPELWR
jgi:hypothetical protein